MLTFKQFLKEGNPLARMHTQQEKGVHFIALSTERPGLTKKQVQSRNKDLVDTARKEGYGVRRAEGRYEGNKESSFIIHAKGPGQDHGTALAELGKRLGQRYEQDSILHHDGKSANLIGTNDSGYPGKNKSEKVGGKLKYNNSESPFQTELRPSKKASSARFTT